MAERILIGSIVLLMTYAISGLATAVTHREQFKTPLGHDKTYHIRHEHGFRCSGSHLDHTGLDVSEAARTVVAALDEGG